RSSDLITAGRRNLLFTSLILSAVSRAASSWRKSAGVRAARARRSARMSGSKRRGGESLMRTNLVIAGAGAILRRVGTVIADAVYPPRCLTCPAPTGAPHGLCAACWRDTHFIAGAACAKCGAPLLGEAGPDDLCDRCLGHPPAWDRGRAAIVYGGAGRRAILAFKHGGRLDAAPAVAGWLAAAGGVLP